MIRKPILLAWLMLCAALTVAAQQGGTTRYIYDQNGRLRAVIAPGGEAAIYDYDPAGNFTAIRRLGANACEALEFTPRQGPFGTRVTIYGVGFKEQVSVVSFNGLPAKIIPPQTPTSVIAEVPDGATTGPVAIALPCGIKTLPGKFTVSGVRVTPQTITLLPGRTAQFIADVMGIIDPAVEWSVNGVRGGNDSVGRITESGVYTVPATALGAQFMIRATSVAEPMLFGEAIVRVAGDNGRELFAAAVSVRYGPLPPPERVPPYLAASAVSVRYGPLPPEPPVRTFLAGSAVSVRYGPLPPNPDVPAYIAGAAVSVRHGPLPPNPNPPSFIAGEAVSVRHGPLPPNPNPPAQMVSGPVSARYGPPAANAAKRAAPAISSASLGVADKDLPLTLTVKGKHLSGVTEIRFFNGDGKVEQNIIATEIEVNSQGTLLTARVTVKEGAVRGRYAVQVLTATGASPVAAAKSNTIEIIP